MPYNFTIQEKQNYILLEVSGNRVRGKGVEHMVPIWTQTTDVCIAKGVYNILAILKLTGRVPVLDSYTIANNIEKLGLGKGFKVALFDTNEESRKDNKFTETVATNRGYLVKVFDNEQGALSWLLKSG